MSIIEKHNQYSEELINQLRNDKLYVVITQFLLDTNFSQNNEEDTKIFTELIGKSDYNNNCGPYEQYMYIQCHWKWRIEQFGKIFSSYISYLDKVHKHSVYEAFRSIMTRFESKDIEIIFNSLADDCKLRFVKCSQEYPTIIKDIPKLKLYNIMS